jgi:hypothetical protein
MIMFYCGISTRTKPLKGASIPPLYGTRRSRLYQFPVRARKAIYRERNSLMKSDATPVPAENP